MNNRIEQPITLKIEDIINEAKDIKSFVFKYNINAKPGQFIMLWIPRLDEKPFGISYQDKNKFAITVSKVGPFTEKLHKMKKGDIVGIRGPYGNSFELKGKEIVLVAGGYGVAPLACLADTAIKNNIRYNFIIGAKSKQYLLFQKRFKNLLFSTDDGSFGHKGFATDLLENVLKTKKPNCVYTCGPELMMKRVVELCDKYNVDCELSLERYIKCGFGICGQCTVDPLGIRMCKEGPVISKKIAKQIFEFGKYKRDAAGKRVII